MGGIFVGRNVESVETALSTATSPRETGEKSRREGRPYDGEAELCGLWHDHASGGGLGGEAEADQEAAGRAADQVDEQCTQDESAGAVAVDAGQCGRRVGECLGASRYGRVSNVLYPFCS